MAANPGIVLGATRKRGHLKRLPGSTIFTSARPRTPIRRGFVGWGALRRLGHVRSLIYVRGFHPRPRRDVNQIAKCT